MLKAHGGAELAAWRAFPGRRPCKVVDQPEILRNQVGFLAPRAGNSTIPPAEQTVQTEHAAQAVTAIGPAADALTLSADRLLAAQREVLSLVARGASVHETLSAIARFFESVLPEMRASVLICEPTTRSLRKGGWGCLPSELIEVVDGLVPGPVAGSCGTAAFRRERVISVDVTSDPLWGAFRDFAASHGIRSAWGSPILSADGALLGAFGMYYGDCRVPSAAELSVADHFVHLAAIAIERHRFDAERDRQSTHDGLTGLGNRRMLDQAVARWSGMSDPPRLTVALLDLDHFRMHNENLGHRIADLLLREAARRIAETTNIGECASRFGRLMADFDRPFDVADMRVRLSLSAGVVDWEPGETEFDDAPYQAEQACKAAKSRGRERQRVAAPAGARRFHPHGALLELKDAGFRLALDDFGTGYASLNQLQQVPFDHVKLDRSMIARLGDGGSGDAICEAAIRMAHACGVPVTAEGVETEAPAAHLTRLGCDRGQGYLWARPLPPLEAVAWMASDQKR